ncbi:MAG: DUF4340 domain-containing protein [Ruminococcaceae bacterium]|nr:DUF4340 domain-containing protein [Oscillospiraceae bacterium]
MNNNVKKIKSSVFVKQKNTIIALAVIFAVLLAAYLFIIMPLMEDDTNVDVTPIELIWKNEVKGVNNRVMMFEHIERASVAEIKVHNPALASTYGKQYVDWSVYRAEKGSEIGGYTIEEDTLYFKGYEFAPIYEDDTTMTSAIASIINDAGYTLTLSRVTDHATDFSKYGLDYENDEEAIYCEITSTDGASYKFYVGDKIPSGTAYYVRVAGKDVCMDKNSEFYGQEIENDSVYIYDCANVLISPTDAISPILTYPMDSNTQAYFDAFSILESYSVDGEDAETVIEFFAVNDSYKKKPISAFAPMALYYTTVPKGYYSSGAFENLFEKFMNGLSGTKVCELATLMTTVDEETGKEELYYGFSDEVVSKYFKDGHTYCISFSWNGFPSVIYVSEMTENATYYVYSLIYNTICEVSADTLSFLEWDKTMFIEKEIFQMNIIQCEKIEISGTYFDYALESGKEAGQKLVEAIFNLEIGKDDSLSVTSPNANIGNMTEKDWVANFRVLYQILLTMGVRDPIDEEYAAEIMKGEHFAEMTVVSAEQTVYKTDDEGNETAVVDYVVPSMTRIFRFYKYTSGRCLVTIESIDENGKSEGETGSFYLMTAGVELMLKSADKLINGETISKYERN